MVRSRALRGDRVVEAVDEADGRAEAERRVGPPGGHGVEGDGFAPPDANRRAMEGLTALGDRRYD